MSNKKIMVGVAFLSVILVLLLMATSFIAIKTYQNSQVPKSEIVETKENTKSETSSLINSAEIMYLDEAIISNVGNHFIVKTMVGFEVDPKSKEYKDFTKTFESKQIVFRDEIIKLFRIEGVNEIEKPNAQQIMREKIKDRLNELLGKEIIMNVYFGEFFIQQ